MHFLQYGDNKEAPADAIQTDIYFIDKNTKSSQTYLS